MAYVSRRCICNFFLFIRGLFKLKDVSITINYTLHLKPDIINLLRFLCTDKTSINATRLL